jgi:tight adherence protein B
MKRLSRLAVIAALAGLWVGVPAHAQEALEIDSIDVSGLPGVTLTASLPADVVSADPSADDFAVVVDGRRVPAAVFALVRQPMEVVVVLDTSGSMEGESLTAAIDGAARFVSELPPEARVGLISFGSKVITHTRPGDSIESTVAALAGLTAGGETALYDAAATAAASFGTGDFRRVVVILSDGGDTASATPFDDTAAVLAAADAEVHAVALDSAEADHAALEALASSGSVARASEASGLAAAYDRVSAELTGRYRIAFSTTAPGETMTVDLYVNGPAGVLSAGIAVDMETGRAANAARVGPPPAGFAAAVGEPTLVTPRPGFLSQPWALPAGVALVFLGVVGAAAQSAGGASPEPGVPRPGHRSRTGGWVRAIWDRMRSVGDSVARRVGTGSMDAALDRAGLALRPGEFVVVAGTGMIAATIAGAVVSGTAGAVAFGAMAAAAPRSVLRVLADRRRRAFADQLEGTLQTISGSLRSGYGLVQAMSTVAAESPSPTAEEFERVIVENQLGRPLEQSLAGVARRLDNEDLGWVVEAIEIQHEVGGNLAEVLDTVTGTIRERNQIRRQIKALSAEGRISAYILLALPFVIGGFIAMISPDYLAELTGTAGGRFMLAGAAVLMSLGAAWIRKIVDVEL